MPMQRKMTPKAFTKQWEEWSTEIPQQTVNEYQGAVLRTFFMHLMSFTPIDTGRLRGNWKVSIDSKPRGASKSRLTDATVTGAPPTATEIGYVEGFNKTLNELPLGRTVYIGNFLNYAKFVEFGTRKMSARAMLEKSRVATYAKLQSGNVRYQSINEPFQ